MRATGIKTSDVIEGQGKGFIVENVKYFAITKQGKLFVYRNACPHIGIALEWVEDQFLDSTKSMIQCANHGALFVIETGQCVSGPCSGQKLKAVHHKINNDEIYIDCN